MPKLGTGGKVITGRLGGSISVGGSLSSLLRGLGLGGRSLGTMPQLGHGTGTGNCWGTTGYNYKTTIKQHIKALSRSSHTTRLPTASTSILCAGAGCGSLSGRAARLSRAGDVGRDAGRDAGPDAGDVGRDGGPRLAGGLVSPARRMALGGGRTRMAAAAVGGRLLSGLSPRVRGR